MSTQTAKIQAVKIILNRAEGSPHNCGEKTVEGPDVWLNANVVLSGWAHTAPGKGNKREGYHKCDYTVVFADGNTFDGRYDLVHFDVELPDLRRHVQNHLDFLSGTRKPDWWTEKQQKEILNYDPAMTQNMKVLLEKYQIGD